MRLRPPPEANRSLQPAALPVFFHTNRPLRNGSDALGLQVISGWWAAAHDIVRERAQFAKSEFPYHAKFALHQARKYEWMLEFLATRRREGSTVAPDTSSELTEPWLLADTDTVFQCTASEFRRRWRRLGSPALVIGAEHKWFPKRDHSHNPWPPTASGLRYPNSGLLLGSAAGFAALRRAFAAMPRYPCCPVFSRGNATGRCHIDDQHCLLIALQQRAMPHGWDRAGYGPWPSRLTPRVPPVPDVTLDSNASLFLNLYGVEDGDLVEHNGRCMYKVTGSVPCVLHANGRAAKPRMRKVVQCSAGAAQHEPRPRRWIVPRGDPWEDIRKAV